MLLIALLSLLAAGFVTVSWWLLSTKRLGAGSVAGSAIVFIWLTGAGTKIYLDRAAGSDGVGQLLNAMESAGWSEPEPTPPIREGAMNNVAPVASLIEGLEARLEAEPGDAKGWALLAQSYAFLGDTAGAEHAVARAVELGFEEADLRNRVDQAMRDAHPPASPQIESRG